MLHNLYIRDSPSHSLPPNCALFYRKTHHTIFCMITSTLPSIYVQVASSSFSTLRTYASCSFNQLCSHIYSLGRCHYIIGLSAHCGLRHQSKSRMQVILHSQLQTKHWNIAAPLRGTAYMHTVSSSTLIQAAQLNTILSLSTEAGNTWPKIDDVSRRLGLKEINSRTFRE